MARSPEERQIEHLDVLRAETVRELRELNDRLDRQIQISTDWKLAIRNGMLIGIGTTLGAAILATILIALLRPFRSFELLGPTLDRLERRLGER